MPSVSIIIVTYNPGETILDCLHALPKAIHNEPLEVIVVDNNSQDDTVQRVGTAFPHVRLLAQNDNRGYGAGNNLGVAQATGEYIVILNPDVAVRHGSLESMIEFLENNAGVGIVGPRTLNHDHQVVITARHDYTVSRLLAKYLGLNLLMPGLVYGELGRTAATSSEPVQADWLHGSALVIRRQVYQQLGGFDEKFFLFMEDVDICMRAKEAGWQVVYLPSAEVEHIGSESVSRHHHTRIYNYHISPLYYYRKRGRHSAVRVLKLGFIASLALKSTLRRLKNSIHKNENELAKAKTEWRVIRDVWGY